MNNYWIALLFAGGITYGLRILPFIAFRNKPIDQNHIAFKYLSYFAYSIMGSIIFDAAFKPIGLSLFVHQFDASTLTKLISFIIAIAVFLLCKRRTLLSLAITVAVYAGLLHFVAHL